MVDFESMYFDQWDFNTMYFYQWDLFRGDCINDGFVLVVLLFDKEILEGLFYGGFVQSLPFM